MQCDLWHQKALEYERQSLAIREAFQQREQTLQNANSQITNQLRQMQEVIEVISEQRRSLQRDNEMLTARLEQAQAQASTTTDGFQRNAKDAEERLRRAQTENVREHCCLSFCCCGCCSFFS